MSQISTRLIKALAVTAAKLNADVKGNGIVSGGGTAITVLADGGTLSVSGSGVKVATEGINNNEINASAAIDFSKLAALTSGNILVGSAGNVATSVAMSSEATIIASGAVTLSNAAVISKVLTAYTAGAGTVTSSDTILSALQKIDGNDALKLPLAGGTMTGHLVMDNQREVRFSELDVSGSAYVAIKAPADLTSGTGSYTLTLPPNDGTAGQALTTNGSGVLTWETSSGGDVDGPASSVDSQVALFDGTTGKLLKAATASGVAHLASGVLSASNVVLTSEVTGVLPVANGGTNSSAALSNNRVMQSSSGAIVEAAAITAARALISDANGIPTHSTVTSTELGYVSGVTSAIQTQINNLSTSIQNFEWQPSVLSSTVLNTTALTPSAGDRYLVNGTGVNGFAGHNNEIAQYVSGDKDLPASWNFTSPSIGMFVASDALTSQVFLYGGASWSAKYFESSTAGAGLSQSGFEIKLADAVENASGIKVLSGAITLEDLGAFDTADLAEGTSLYFTDERAQDAVGAMVTSSSKVSLTYVDGTPSLTADIVAASLVNADISLTAAIDATKIANGTVTNAEFQTLSDISTGITIQAQIDGKANKALDNLASTAVNADILPATDVTVNLGTTNKAWVGVYASNIIGSSAADLNIASQAPAGVNSRAVLIKSANAASTFNSGAVSLKSGSGSGGSAASGGATFGSGLAAGTSGFTKVLSGNGASSGIVTLNSGDATAGTSGTVDMYSGASTGNSGALSIYSGDSSAGNSGNITLQAGTASGTRGSIILSGLQINASSSKIINVTDPTSAQDAATKAYVDLMTFVSAQEEITVGANEYFDLAQKAEAASVQMMFEGVVQRYGIDFIVDNSGAVSRIKFDATSTPNSDLRDTGAIDLTSSDKVYMSYQY